MRIQVVQDLVCPWCRIGKHHLDTALAERQATNGETFEIEWLPYLLNPVEPGSAEPFREQMKQSKGFSDEQLGETFRHVTETGAELGITFNFDQISVAVDTVPYHILVAMTNPLVQSELIDAAHVAYFEQGQNLGDPDAMIEVARSIGLSDAEIAPAKEQMTNPEQRQRLMEVIGQIQQVGVTGVPFFILNDSLGVAGAQPPEVLNQAIDQALSPETVSAE